MSACICSVSSKSVANEYTEFEDDVEFVDESAVNPLLLNAEKQFQTQTSHPGFLRQRSRKISSTSDAGEYIHVQ